MTIDEAKAIVLAKYPHAYCGKHRCTAGVGWKYVVCKNWQAVGNWLSGEHRTELAAWQRAARTVRNEP